MYTAIAPDKITTWESIPCLAKRCLGQVKGSIKEMVEVIIGTRKHYISNEDNTGWLKVTDAPNIPVEQVNPDKVVCYLEN